jgi:hypothetical protein
MQVKGPAFAGNVVPVKLTPVHGVHPDTDDPSVVPMTVLEDAATSWKLDGQELVANPPRIEELAVYCASVFASALAVSLAGIGAVVPDEPSVTELMIWLIMN